MRIPDATERKALVTCFGISGLICSAPGDFVSAGFLWAIAFAGYAVHQRLLKKETKAAEGGPSPTVAAEPSDASTEADASPTDPDADQGKAA